MALTNTLNKLKSYTDDVILGKLSTGLQRLMDCEIDSINFLKQSSNLNN